MPRNREVALVTKRPIVWTEQLGPRLAASRDHQLVPQEAIGSYERGDDERLQPVSLAEG